jgi:ABC-type thiamine transport system ATPase subunit
MHPKVRTDPALRARYGISGGKNHRFFIAGILLSITAAWFIWSGFNAANPKLRSELISFKVIDEQRISITYKITVRDLTKDHSCSVVARDIDKNTVGQVADLMPAGSLIAGSNLRTVEIATRLPAVNAGIAGCQ